MTEVTDSILFRQKLYDNFKQSGLLSKLKTSLRANLLQKLQKPATVPVNNVDSLEKDLPFHLKRKFLESIIAEHLLAQKKQYSLSIFMAECDLQQEDCLRYDELSEIMNLGKPSNGRSFLYRVTQQIGNIKCTDAIERSAQTDFDQPLGKKLELIDKEYKSKIDYWKLIPNSSISKQSDSAYEQEQKLRMKFQQEKQQFRKQLQLRLKQETQKKYENQYLFRMREVQKQHETRISDIKNRQKAILDGLDRKRKDLDEKSRSINEEQLKMINRYELKMNELEASYREKMRNLQLKEKEFWKKQLQLKAKKRQYEQTIRLVKQKVIGESSQ